MPVSLLEAINTLLAGSKLSWDKFESHKAGSIQLKTPAQRRLFRFLIKQDVSAVAQASETLFSGIIDAWNDDKYDPATDTKSVTAAPSTSTWRLERIEASNFGGLTIFSGRSFDPLTNEESWCIEGQNGSGKTSLSSAILWRLTGKRIREQDGPIEDDGKRAPVYDANGSKIGEWPPIVSYPQSSDDLTEDAEAWVKLTFKNQNGEQATAFRKISSPFLGTPTQKLVSTTVYSWRPC